MNIVFSLRRRMLRFRRSTILGSELSIICPMIIPNLVVLSLIHRIIFSILAWVLTWAEYSYTIATRIVWRRVSRAFFSLDWLEGCSIMNFYMELGGFQVAFLLSMIWYWIKTTIHLIFKSKCVNCRKWCRRLLRKVNCRISRISFSEKTV